MLVGFYGPPETETATSDEHLRFGPQTDRRIPTTYRGFATARRSRTATMERLSRFNVSLTREASGTLIRITTKGGAEEVGSEIWILQVRHRSARHGSVKL